MKDIYTLYEGLLQGQDATLNDGDDMLKKAKSELSTIKTCTDHSNHRLWQSSKYGWEGRRYSIGVTVKSLAAILGYWDKIDIMRIMITKDGDNDQWVIDITFYNSNYRVTSSDSDNWKMATIKYPFSSVKTFPTLLKRHVAPIFDSIETLKKFMNDNKVR
jgi:hypothetical protein